MHARTQALLLLFVACVAVIALGASLCEAQTGSGSWAEARVRGADSLADLIVRKSQAWIPALQSAAKGLFAGLAVIQLGWIGVRSILLGHGKVEDALGSMVWEVVQLAFFALLIDKGPEWGLQVIESLQEVGRRAAQTATRPQDLLNHANDLCLKILDEMSVFDGPAYAICMGFGLLLMLVSMICIATFTLVGWAQAFIVLGAGTIVLGLGGSVWTRPIAAGYLRNALAAGLKLLTLELIASIMYGEVEVWIDAAGKDFGVPLFLKILGSCILTLILILSVPSYVASMVTAGGVMSVAEGMITRGALALAAWKGLAAGRVAMSAGGASAPPTSLAAASAAGPRGVGFGAGARAGAGGPVPDGGRLEEGAPSTGGHGNLASAGPYAPSSLPSTGSTRAARVHRAAAPIQAAEVAPAASASSPRARGPSHTPRSERRRELPTVDDRDRAQRSAGASSSAPSGAIERAPAAPAPTGKGDANDAARRERGAPTSAATAGETLQRHGPAPQPPRHRRASVLGGGAATISAPEASGDSGDAVRDGSVAAASSHRPTAAIRTQAVGSTMAAPSHESAPPDANSETAHAEDMNVPRQPLHGASAHAAAGSTRAPGPPHAVHDKESSAPAPSSLAATGTLPRGRPAEHRSSSPTSVSAPSARVPEPLRSAAAPTGRAATTAAGPAPTAKMPKEKARE